MQTTYGQVRPLRLRLTGSTPLFKVVILVLLVVTGSPQAALAKQNDRVKTLATVEAWRAVQHADPFADPQRYCSIRSTGFNADTARRGRPRLRISLDRRKFAIDASFKLTHATRALRDILEQRRGGQNNNRMEQFKPDNRLVYKLRVDDGEVITNQDQAPRFEPWTLNLDVSGFDTLIAAMRSGNMLYIGWSIDRAGEQFSFNLKGFDRVAGVSEQHCPVSEAPRE